VPQGTDRESARKHASIRRNGGVLAVWPGPAVKLEEDDTQGQPTAKAQKIAISHFIIKVRRPVDLATGRGKTSFEYQVPGF